MTRFEKSALTPTAVEPEEMDDSYLYKRDIFLMQINWDVNPEFDGDVQEHPRNIEHKFKNIVYRSFLNSPL